LFDYLRGKEMLLVLDNVEQALEPVADLVVVLLEMAPRLYLLVTSREYLQLRSETRLPLDGLPFPPDDSADPASGSLADCDAMRLLGQEAQRVKPDFRLSEHETAAAALCRVVEGLPLAIELAAALLDSQTPDQLLTQIEKGFDLLITTMRDVPQRHRGLRAVFDYSWTLLTPVQQAVLARLALFQGGFTSLAASTVAEAREPLLMALAAKSLVRQEASGRYSLHEVIRQYALERLEHKDLIADKYVTYFAVQIEQATAALHGPQQTTVARQLLADLANIEATWQMAVAAGKVDMLLAMAPGLTRFYQVTGLFQAGAAAFNTALARLPSPPPALYIYQAVFWLEQHEYVAAETAVATALATGLTDSGLLAQAHLITTAVHIQHGKPETGQETINQALAAAKVAQIPWLEAQVWRRMGELAERSGDYNQAEVAISQALAIYETSGDPMGLAQTYQVLGAVHFRRGDMTRAKGVLEKALAVRRQVDASGLSSARVLVNLGSVIGNLGQEEEARRYFQDALAVFEQTGDRAGAALASDMLGEAAANRYDFAEARAYLEQALALRQEIGQRKGIADASRHLADLALRLGAYDKARQILTDVLETYGVIQDRRGLGTTLARLALVHSFQGRYETAEQEARVALAVAGELGNPLLQAYGLSSLGHALRGQTKWEQAAVIYADAINLWQKWDAQGLKAQMQASLASVHYANGQVDATWPLLEAAVNCLVDNPQPDCDALGQLYLDCILLLQAKGDDEQAARLWQQAVVTLHRQAAGITQEQSRATFLTGITAHQRLFALDLPRHQRPR
jgi:predicted ATPase